MAGRRKIRFATLGEKARWLDANASLDAAMVMVRDVAQRFAAAHQGDAEALARGIHRWVRDHIRYVADTAKVARWRPAPDGEEFADSETILARGFDDCDGKSRLFVALCRAAGIECRIRPVFRRHPLDFVHVQAECRWPGSASLTEAEPGGWLLAELILKDCALGQDPDAMPRGPDGKRVLA